VTPNWGVYASLPPDTDLTNTSLRLSRNSLAGWFGVALQGPDKEASPPSLPRIEAERDVFANSSISSFKSDEVALRRLKWEGSRNLYAPEAGFTVQRPKGLVKGRADWKKWFGPTDLHSLEGEVRFQGKAAIGRFTASPERITAADFRLADGSAGKGKGPGGKDLGADVDLVGPGGPYERWKQTPEHADWRKKADALMAEARLWPLDRLSPGDIPAHELRAAGGGGAGQAPAERLAAHAMQAVCTWEVVSARVIGDPGPVDEARRASFRPDGRRLAWSGGLNFRISEVPPRQGMVLPDNPGYGPTYGPDGKVLAFAQYPWQAGAKREGHDVCLCGAEGVRAPSRLQGHTDFVNCLAFSPDGKLLASGSCDRTAILWDAVSGKKLCALTGHRHFVHGAAFSPDGLLLVTGGGGARYWERAGTQGEVKVWDVATGEEALDLDGHAALGDVWSVAWSGDGRLIAAASADRTVKLWDAGTGKEARTFREHGAGVGCVLFRRGSSALLSVDDGGVLLEWDGASGKVLRRWQLPDTVGHLDLAADGRHLATANWNGTVYVLRLEPGPPGP
jgi:hypothetical protein